MVVFDQCALDAPSAVLIEQARSAGVIFVGLVSPSSLDQEPRSSTLLGMAAALVVGRLGGKGRAGRLHNGFARALRPDMTQGIEHLKAAHELWVFTPQKSHPARI
jgi:hypothetical protein